MASEGADKKQQQALLLHFGRHGVQEIFKTQENTREDYETPITKLCEYFLAEKEYSLRAPNLPSSFTGAEWKRWHLRHKAEDLWKLRQREWNDSWPGDWQVPFFMATPQFITRKRNNPWKKILTIVWALEASKTQASRMEGPSTPTTNASVNTLPQTMPFLNNKTPRQLQNQSRLKSREPSKRTSKP